MQATTNGHNKVTTVSQLAASLKIDSNQALLLLSQLGVKADSPESPVPHAIASQLMQVGEDINSFTSPRLMGEKEPPSGEEMPQQDDDSVPPPSALTLADAKTIAEVNNVSIDLVQAMVEVMQSRYEKLLLQQGYYTQKREQAIANLGSTLATMETYREKLTAIQKKQDEILSFDAAEFLKGHGIDIQKLIDSQLEFEKNLVSSNGDLSEQTEGEAAQKNPFDQMIESLGKLG